jgi:riboflavin synthase
MFTGIIQKVGTVISIEATSSESYRLKMNQPFSPSEPIDLGESIAHNGVCLTVTKISAESLEFDLAPETMRCTALGRLKPGSLVNLERSLRIGDRLSGHWVQGHVDGTARIIQIESLSSTQYGGTGYFNLILEMTNPELLKYCVKKGSISIDGISLTIHEIDQKNLHFQIIPHTWEHTALPDLKSGDLVNIEVDLLAKYAENFSARTPTSSRN